MRFVILHFHIFKNAGSTVEDILDHSFGERFGTLETPVGTGLISSSELVEHLNSRPDLLSFSSHQIRYPLPEAHGYLFFDICFLRDPLDRLRSYYDYFRQRPNPADPMSELANRCDLGDFVAGMIEHHSLFIRNNQVNLLACGGDSDEPNERDFELAVRRAMAASFLGVVDCFEQSAVAGQAALRYAFPHLNCKRPPVNVSKGMQGTVASRTEALRAACRPEVFEELLRITELDRRLVELARAEVLRRFDAVHARRGRAEAGCGQGFAPRKPARNKDPLRQLVRTIPFWRQMTGRGREILFDRNYCGASFLRFLLDGGEPHPLFDPAFYLRQYPDVAAAGVNPLLHYLKYGTAEMRQPHPLFDPAFYLDRNPDVGAAGIDPLLHYIRNGAAEDRKPHPLFEPAYYRATSGECPANPLVHFLSCGVRAASPHPLFDCRAYLEAHPEVDENPLVHYLESWPASNRPGKTHNLDIQDVGLDVFCRAKGSDSEAATAIPVESAVVWQDAGGQTHWIAEPQQMPFLRAVGFDQIQAQLKTLPVA
jgi:hypothetical protein